MKQVTQNYGSGTLSLEEVPRPICRRGGVLVRAAYSLVSAGTERMKVDQARMNVVQKAKARPDKVRQVTESIRQVGLLETYNKVRERLHSLTPLGYSLTGVVVEVGAGVDEFQIGDRVACAGESIACHAEFVSVPRNLCVQVPEGVDLKDAAFATVGAIAMNGVRQARVGLGDSVLVVGLGLVGLLAIQLLKAAGCRVVGVDLDPKKMDMAKRCGADIAMTRDNDSLESAIAQLTGGRGIDAAYIAASTQSTDPLEFAGRVMRDRGTVVIVGMVKVDVDWQTYYRKELSVVMSRSYGPGRYDPDYEEKGIDYPIGYVRWTQRRNLEEFIHLIRDGRVKPGLLGPDTFAFDRAPEVYQRLHDAPNELSAAVLFEYPQEADAGKTVLVAHTGKASRSGPRGANIGFIGAGNFATGTLIPALKKAPGARFGAICSARGLSAKSAAQRHGFTYCASDYKELLADDGIDAVVIATRHNTHAGFTVEALKAGKHVFVEKPLALSIDELQSVIDAAAESGKIVMPGFNRRFSPLSVALRDAFADRAAPIEVLCRVNAGPINADSWYKDEEEGGWRIVSEGCHFVDLIQFICGCPAVETFAQMIGGGVAGMQNDNCAVTLKMEDGSLGTILYVANGDPQYEKERIEVFGLGRVGVIENWRCARIYAGGRRRTISAAGSGKGHAAEMAAFVRAVQTGTEPPLRFDEAVNCTQATFAIASSMISQQPQACQRLEAVAPAV